MADLDIEQIYDENPSTTVADDALFYIGLSPYAAGDDSAIKKQDLFAQINGNLSDANGNTIAGTNSGSSGPNATYLTIYGVENLNSYGTGPVKESGAFGAFNLRSSINDIGNWAFGYNNGSLINGGNYNFMGGYGIFQNLVNGNKNIGIGGDGQNGSAYTGSESGNINIGNSIGTTGENYVTRMGYQAGKTVSNPQYVAVDSATGKLGSKPNFATLTDAATVAVDLSLAVNFNLTLGGNRTLGVPTNIVAGMSGLINTRQDITGSRTLSYSWVYEFAGGSAPVLSTAALSFDQLNYFVNNYSTSTVTITIASPAVVTWTSHGLISGQKIQLTTTGALPTGLSASTTYWVTVVDANTFKLSTSLANAQAATFINTSGSQSGVHTAVNASILIAPNFGIA